MQYQKLQRKLNECAEEWIGRVRYKATVSKYCTKYDWKLKEQFIHGISNETTMNEIIRELTSAAEVTEINSTMVYHSPKE